MVSKQFKMNKAGNTNREVATVENASKGPEYMRKDSIFINDGTPGGTVKFESQVVGNSNYELSKITNTYNGNTVVKATNKVTGEIHSFKNFGNAQTGNSLSVTNANTSLVPLNPNVATGVTVTTSSSARTVTGSVGSNLITSGKSVTTLEAPKNPVIKPFIKPKQDIETVKKPAVTSEKPKTAERSHSQGSNNHNSNKESFNQKTEKNPNRNPAGENYGTEKTSNKMPPFSNRENIHRNSNTQNYDYKVQDNSTSNGSSNGDSGSKKNIEPSVENSGKIYTLESQDANWNFKSEIPKTAVKNSEGNYTLGRETNWNSKGLNLDDSSVRVINADGTSNVPKGTRYITIDNRPYIENGKPKGRPSFRKDFPQKLYNQYNGVVQDPNTKEIINWKPGEPKKGIVDFGHKPDRKYSDIFYQEYLPEKWTPQQLRDWYNDPQNYQFEVPINNQGHKFE